MLLKLLLLLTLVPALELVVLVYLTMLTDISVTLLVILLTGVVGAFLARGEGLKAMRRIQEETVQGRLPGDSILDGAMILVAAALLVTPGLITDATGLLLLIPFTRARVRKLVKRWIKRRIELGRVQVFKHMGFGPISHEPSTDAPESDEKGRDS